MYACGHCSKSHMLTDGLYVANACGWQFPLFLKAAIFVYKQGHCMRFISVVHGARGPRKSRQWPLVVVSFEMCLIACGL